MKALSVTIPKFWPMLKFFADKQTNRVRDTQAGQKLYAPDQADMG